MISSCLLARKTHQRSKLQPQIRSELAPLVCHNGVRSSKTGDPRAEETPGQFLAVTSARGIVSNHHEYLSMMVSRYLHPSDSGSGPTMSRCRAVKRRSGISRGAKGALVCLVIFALWQAKQARQKALTCEDMLRHTNRRRTSRRRALPPGWATPWTLVSRRETRAAGTTGRGAAGAWETSQRIFKLPGKEHHSNLRLVSV